MFLHATLEDLLRTTLAWRWPRSTNPEHFGKLTFVLPNARKEKITIAELVQQGYQRVDEVVGAAIDEHLKTSNFNNILELRTALERSGLDPNIVDPHVRQLAALMARRHWIVHRVDRNATTGRGQHPTQSLGVGTVQGWVKAVRGVGEAILAKL